MAGEQYQPECIVPTVMFGGGGLMVHGYFSEFVLSHIVPVKEGTTSYYAHGFGIGCPTM